MNKIFINTDGGSRGNPGPAAIGIVFYSSDEKDIFRYQEFIGSATNNEAEYRAILKALQILIKSKWFCDNNLCDKEVICRLDSQLVVEQVKGNYKVKQEHLALFVAQIRELISQMELKISFIYVPREQNRLADKLVNLALDAELKK